MAEEWFQKGFIDEVKNLRRPGSGGGSPDAVLYTAQTLTEEQKAQARANIDAERILDSVDAIEALTAAGFIVPLFQNDTFYTDADSSVYLI